MSHNYTTKDIARFNKKINKDASNGCWEWQASCFPGGYGRFQVNGKPIGAHRVSYEMNVGKIPDGLHVCHTCDNPKCVNPNHLFLGTHTDNMRDMFAKGRCVRNQKGSLNNASKLTEEDVVAIKYMRKNGFKLRVIAEKYGVSLTTISAVMCKQNWSSVP